MKFRWFRNFLKGCSLTTALFIFQACYGTPSGIHEEAVIKDFSFEVFNADGTQALSNAKIYATLSDNSLKDSTITGANGKASLSLVVWERLNPTFNFTIQAEGYIQKDTTVNYSAEEDTLKIYLQKK